jgi:hypothetical protein
LAARRRPSTRTRASLIGHVALLLGFVVLAIFPATPVYKDAEFAVLRGERQRVVSEILSGAAKLEPDPGARNRVTVAVAHGFPRIACCGNTVVVFDGGRQVLFPSSLTPPSRAISTA